MRYPKWLGILCAIGLLCLQTGLAQAAPENGWWWNPNQSGRGFSIEIQGDTLFMAGYLYENDGRAAWLVSAGPMEDATTYQGRLLAVSNGQTLTGDYQAPAAPTDAGAITLQFTDDTHGTLTWPGGAIPIERYRFSSAAAASVQPQTGWWWNPDESGRGFFIEVQGNRMFTAGYMYDANGKPVWYVSDGTMASPTTYQGVWYQFANGQTLTGPYQPPGAPVIAGSVTAAFTASDRVTLTLSDSAVASSIARLGSPKVSPKIIYAKRYRYGKVPHLDRPKFWEGTYTYNFNTGREGVVDYSKLSVTGSVTWVDSSFNDDLLAPLDGSTEYEILEGSAKATLEESVTTTTGACPGTSTATGTSNERLFPSEGNLKLATDGSYTGSLFFPVTLDVQFVTPCARGTRLISFVVFIDLTGNMAYLNMHGDHPDVGLIPGAQITSSWNFNAKP